MKACVSSGCGPYWTSSPCARSWVPCPPPTTSHVLVGRSHAAFPGSLLTGRGCPVPRLCSASANSLLPHHVLIPSEGE